MSLFGRSQRFLVRYTVVDFAKDFLKEVFFSMFVWTIYKLGRILINWSKPYLREFMYILELIFHYYAVKLRLESPWRFLAFCIKYLFRKNAVHTHINANTNSINRKFTRNQINLRLFRICFLFSSAIY